MTRPVLEARALEARYADGVHALRGVDLALHPGERVGLVGPNGAGKSTLLLHLTGVLPAAQGALWLEGEALSPARGPELHRRVGLVFQQADDMLFTTRVEDDVAFGPRQLGLPRDEVRRRVDDALDAVDAGDLRERVPQHLSAGQKRKVALAAALSMQPDVLLLDEPTSDLDPRGRRALLGLLRELPQAVLIASHDLEFVLGLCDRVVVLDEGKVVADGPAREILGDEPLMLTHGLERPHSLTPHAHRHDHDPLTTSSDEELDAPSS
jgi:cobalt/nickel transport system ATP-binding protein